MAEAQTQVPSFVSEIERFSSAQRIVAVAADTEVRSSTGSDHSQWPPILSVGDMTNQVVVRGETIDRDAEAFLRQQVSANLVKWAHQGMFDMIPLPNRTSDDNIGFRLTPEGVRLVIDSFRTRADRLADAAAQIQARAEDPTSFPKTQ